MRRLCIGLLTGFCSLVLAGPASACNVEDLAVTPSAGPGDTVGWSIGNMTPGAGYSVRFQGQTQSGQAGAAGSASGSFVMPDLGNRAQEVTVSGMVSHEATADDPGSYPLSAAVQYVPPAPAAPLPSAGDPAAGVPKIGADHHAPARSGDAGSGGSGGGDAAVALPAGPGVGPASAAPASPSAAADSPASVPKAAESAADSVPQAAIDALGGSSRVGPAEVPNLALGVTGLIFLLGTGLAAFIVYLLSSGPDPNAAVRAPAPPGADPLETELQEMLADEMARKLLSDLSLEAEAGGSPALLP